MDYNPLDPEVTRNPYPYYAFLRREVPVCRTPLGFLAVSRYDDVLEILRHPDQFSSSAMGDVINQVKSLSHENELGGVGFRAQPPPAFLGQNTSCCFNKRLDGCLGPILFWSFSRGGMLDFRHTSPKRLSSLTIRSMNSRS